MAYVYTDNSLPVPEGEKIWQLAPPEGGWVTFENGARRLVTKLLDAEDFSNSPFGKLETGTEYTKVDLIQELRDQLNRIEAAVTPVVARSPKKKRR